MNFQLLNLNRKLLAFVGGGVTLVFMAVLGLAVWRVQNQQSTVSRPRAMDNPVIIRGCKSGFGDSGSWICDQANANGYQKISIYDFNGNQMLPASSQTNNPYFTQFSWNQDATDRRTFRVTVDPRSGYSTQGIICTNGFVCYIGNQPECRSFETDNCSAGGTAPTVTDGVTASVVMPGSFPTSSHQSGPYGSTPFVSVDWRFTAVGPAGCPNPYRADNGTPQGQIVGTTPDFNWSWCHPSSIDHDAVYLWSCDPNSAGCTAAIAEANGGGTNKDSAPFSTFFRIGGSGAVVLSPNTVYYWTVDPNTCASFPSTNCPIGSGPTTWSFRTGTTVQTGTVQGCKILGVTGDCYAAGNAPFNSTQVTLDSVAATQLGNSAANSYTFTNVAAGSHSVAVPSAPAGYSVTGYSLCTNQTNCHTTLTGTSNSVAVNVPASGYVDLWWHFAISCTSGQTLCGSTCVNTQTDNANCGACGTTCTIYQTCTSGSCVLTSCPANRRLCGGTCINPYTDVNNCGSCGNVCSTGQTCSNGACFPSCASGQIICSSTCVNGQTDNNNCGTCGNVCATGMVCTNGACANQCASGQNFCSGGCKNFQTDAANCGSCGNACSAGQVCTNGACVAACGSGQTLCGTTCVNLQTDANNCGACRSLCPSGAVCSSGSCQTSCASGQTACGSSCVNTQTDSANCGACGNVCGTGKVCTNGACANQCASGQTFCSNSCRDTQTDNSNCGSCGNACASGQTCTSGQCVIAATHFVCQNQTCTQVTGAGANANGCSSAGGTCCASSSDCGTGQTCDASQTPNVCTTNASNEVLACQGNGGNNGKCFDCNGDGVINMLDFACFRAKYGSPVTR